MKRHVVLSLIFGCLCLIVSGTTDETFNKATKTEKGFSSTVNSRKTFNHAKDLRLSSSNSINLQEPSNDSTNLEKSSTHASDIGVKTWKNFPYVIQYGTNPELQYGLKSKIKGGFKKIKNKVKDGFKKVKDIGKDLLKNKLKDLLKNKVKDLLKDKIPIPINSVNSDLKSFPYIIRNGTDLELQNGIQSKIDGINLKLSSRNAIDLQESPNDSTNLEKLSTNATDFSVSPWKKFPYVIQYGTNPELQYGFKSKIKSGFKKIKNKVKGGLKKVKDIGKDLLKNKLKDLLKNKVKDLLKKRIPIPINSGNSDLESFPYIIHNGTDLTLQDENKSKINEMNLELSFRNSIDLQDSFNDSTNLEDSSINASDLKVSPWKFFPYVIQNGTNPELQYGLKSKIKGGFKKIKNKIKDGFKKIKDKAKNFLKNKTIDVVIPISSDNSNLNFFSYVNQNGTNPELQYGFKSKIKGGFKKIKNKMKDGFKKIKDKAKNFLKNKTIDVRIPISSDNSNLKFLPYVIENRTDPELQHEIKSEIKSNFNNIKDDSSKEKNHVNDFDDYNKTKDEFADIETHDSSNNSN